MTTDAEGELARLRKIAYGRTSTPEQERAAADARRTLAERERAAAAGAAAAADAAAAEHETGLPPDLAGFFDAGDAPIEPEVTAAGPRRRWWPGVAIALALVVGFGSGFGAASSLQGPATVESPSAPPEQEPDHTQVLTPEERAAADARLAAALAVFERAQTAEDRTFDPEIVETVHYDPSSVRILGKTYAGNVYAATNPAGDICMIVMEDPDGWGAGCASQTDFGVYGGLNFGMNSFIVSWDGSTLSSELAPDPVID